MNTIGFLVVVATLVVVAIVFSEQIKAFFGMASKQVSSNEDWKQPFFDQLGIEPVDKSPEPKITFEQAAEFIDELGPAGRQMQRDIWLMAVPGKHRDELARAFGYVQQTAAAGQANGQ